VFASRNVARVGLALNLIGAISLFYAFQATSSDFKLVTTKDGRYALCADKTALVIKETNGFGIGIKTCPEWDDGKPAAVVNVEKPWLVTFGFISTFLGFLLQFFTIPSDQTAIEMQKELKLLKKTRKELDKSSRKPPTVDV
jgi:hypothetical protein